MNLAAALADVPVAAGLPAGVINVLTGELAIISEHLVSSPVVRKNLRSPSAGGGVGKTVLRLAFCGSSRASHHGAKAASAPSSSSRTQSSRPL